MKSPGLLFSQMEFVFKGQHTTKKESIWLWAYIGSDISSHMAINEGKMGKSVTCLHKYCFIEVSHAHLLMYYLWITLSNNSRYK